MLAFLMPVLVSSVAEASTQTFTTTAQFDAGNKSDPGTEWFAANGVDQPWNSASYPRAFKSSACGKTFNVWQAATDPHAQAWIASYDPANGNWVSNRVGTDIFEDGHGTPALAVTNDGYIHVFYGGHGTTEFYYRSSSPCDSTSFTNMTAISASATYPQVFILSNGTMQIIYRIHAAGDNGHYVTKWSENSGTSWSGERVLFNFGQFQSIYPGDMEIYNNLIYIPFAKYSAGLRTGLYLCRFNMDTKNMEDFDGTNLGSYVDSSEADNFCRIFDTGSKEVWFPIVHIGRIIYSPSEILYRPFIIYNAENTTAGVREFNWTYEASPANWAQSRHIVNTGEVHNSLDFQNDGLLVDGGGNPLNQPSIRAYMIVSGGSEAGNLEQYTMTGLVWSKVKTLLVGRLSAPAFTRNDANTLFFNERWFFGPITAKIYAYQISSSTFITNAALSSGTYGVETITDNGAVPADEFKLANGLGDTFSYANPTLDTFKWFASTVGTLQYQNHTVSGGVARMSVHSTTTNAKVSAITRYSFADTNFDVQIRTEKISAYTGFQQQWFFGMETEQTPYPHKFQGGTATVDGVYYERLPTTQLQAYQVTDGVPSQVGINSFPANPVLWFRITRTGTNTITWYYRTTDVGSWVQDQQTAFTFTGSFYVFFGVGSALDQEFEVDYDNFLVNVGSLNDAETYSGYRHSGAWASAVQTYADDKVIPWIINLTFSGVSVSDYIDSVAIVSSSNQVIFEDGTDHTIGTTASVTIPFTDYLIEALRNNWRVRVSLVGDGTSSASITSVSVFTAFFETSGGLLAKQAISGMIIAVFLAVLVLGVIGAVWLRHRFS